MQELWEAVQPHVIALLTALLGALVIFARSGLTKLIQAHVDNVAMRTALSFLNETAFSVVSAAQQTAVAELKKAYADGKIKDEELKAGLAAIKKAVTDEILALTWGKLSGALGLGSKDEARAIVETKVESLIAPVKAVASPLAKAPSA